MGYVHAMLASLAMVGLMTGLSTAASAQEPIEIGTKQVGGLEVTLLSASPLSPEEVQQMMPGMGGMGGMMRGMPGMGGMGGAEAPPTHWIGVIVRDLNDDRVVPSLPITLTAQKGGLTRTVTLMAMRASYGANINLPEKGRYTATISIARPGQPVSVVFDFEYE